MKSTRLSLVLTTFCLLAGCESIADSTSLPQSGSAGDVKAVYEQLSFVRWATFQVTAPPQERSPDYAIDKVLSRLHGWLKRGVGLTYVRKLDYEFLALKKIPDKVLSDLEAITYPDSIKTGFGILQQSFWQEIAQRQREGLTVGFITKAPSLVAGIYYSIDKFIGFDLFANGGTMVHEFRHHIQHREISRRLKARHEKRKWRFWEKDLLDETCIHAAGSYFGELDSTTQQLSTWSGVIDALPVLPADEEEAKRVDGWFVMTIPQLLSANLEYPVFSADWIIREESCPQSLRDVISELKLELTRQKVKVASDTLSKLYTARGQVIRQPEKRGEIERSLELKKMAVETALNELVNTRSERTRAILSTIDPEIKNELCERATAFSYLADCEDN
jgi:hypothetical protein